MGCQVEKDYKSRIRQRKSEIELINLKILGPPSKSIELHGADIYAYTGLRYGMQTAPGRVRHDQGG